MATALLTNSGVSALITRIIGSGTQPSIIAWGTGAGVSHTADNTVSGMVNDYVTGTASAWTSARVADTYSVVGVLSATGNYTITNVALFDQTPNAFIKADFDGVPLYSGDSITFTFWVQF